MNNAIMPDRWPEIIGLQAVDDYFEKEAQIERKGGYVYHTQNCWTWITKEAQFYPGQQMMLEAK